MNCMKCHNVVMGYDPNAVDGTYNIGAADESTIKTIDMQTGNTFEILWEETLEANDGEQINVKMKDDKILVDLTDSDLERVWVGYPYNGYKDMYQLSLDASASEVPGGVASARWSINNALIQNSNSLLFDWNLNADPGESYVIKLEITSQQGHYFKQNIVANIR